MNYGFKSNIDSLMDSNPLKIDFYKKYKACSHEFEKVPEKVNNETVYLNTCKTCGLAFYTED